MAGRCTGIRLAAAGTGRLARNDETAMSTSFQQICAQLNPLRLKNRPPSENSGPSGVR